MNLKLKYIVYRDELSNVDSWVLPVLQTNYIQLKNLRGTVEAFVIEQFKKWLKIHRAELLTLDVEALNQKIYARVQELEAEFPEAFTRDLGWFSKKKLVELYLNNKITFIDYTIEEQIHDKEKEIEEKRIYKENLEAANKAVLARRRAEEEIRLAEIELKRKTKEDNRVPVEIGMFFLTKSSMLASLKGLEDFPPKASLQSKLVSEFAEKYFSFEKTDTPQKKNVWVILGIRKEGARAYQENIGGYI
jgi:hypothetical protein